MYSFAPRCSEARSLMSVPAWSRPEPPPAANALNDRSMPHASAATRARKVLFMHRHPIRHRLGLVPNRPQRHGQEEQEVVGGQEPADDGLGRVRARAGADLAQPDE